MSNFSITVSEDEFNIEERDLDALDVHADNDNKYHVLHRNKAYHVELLHANFIEKTLTLSINGSSYDIHIQDSYDQVVKKMGLLSNSSQKLQNIKAPMPGLIINIMVEVGQEISEGTPLIVLSAMKMENQILSQGAGIIKSVEVKVGDTVDKGQLIIEME